MGVAARFSNLGNEKVLGKEFSLTAFFKLDIIKKRNFRFYNQTGVGFGYVTRKFDFVDNYMNVAVGSHLNTHFNSRFGVGYSLTNKCEINLGLVFNHFSNANLREPNLGINTVSVFGGVNYLLGQSTKKQKNEIGPHVKSNYTEVFLSFGGKHTRALSSKKYLTSSLSLEFNRASFRFFHIGYGLDIFYDSSIEDQLISIDEDYKNAYSFQTGIHIAPTFIYNRLNLIIQQGVYLGLTERIENYTFYNRGIIKYWINERMSVRVAMKSHLHILDFPEIGIGVKF